MPIVNRQTVKPAAVTSNRTQTDNRPESVFDSATELAGLPNSGYKFLIFGPSGSGKTTLACDFPKPLLLIRPEEVEDGSLSVRTVKGVYATPFITTPDQLADICAGQRSTGKYRTMVLDGATKFQDLVVKKHMGLEDVPVQQTWGMVPQADWNLIGIMVKGYLRDLLRFAKEGVHIVIVCGERVIGQEDNRQTRESILIPAVMAALTPSITGWVHDVCDFNVCTLKRRAIVEKKIVAAGKPIIQRSKGKIEYCLRVGPDDDFATKFRVPKGTALPDILVDPTFDKINKLIRGE